MARPTVPKHKTQKKKTKSKPKPKSQATNVSKKPSKAQKLRQTRLSFETPEAHYEPLTAPKGGARMEMILSGRYSPSLTADTTPGINWKDVDYDGSPDPLDNLGPRRVKIHDKTVTRDPRAKSPSIISVNSSPPSSPNPIRAGMKRKHQSRIDDHFSAHPSSLGNRRRSALIESDSESDTLDHIQLEPEPSEPHTLEPTSDADSDDILSPVVRRRRHLPLPPKEKNTDTMSESDNESDTLENNQAESEPSEPSEPRTPEAPSDNDSDTILSPNVRRRRHLPLPPKEQNTETSTGNVSEEVLSGGEDLSEEEVRDITSSARKSSVSSRMRDSVSRNKRKSAFQKNLENLRKKKQGLQDSDGDPDEDEEEEASEDGKGLYDSESDLDSVETDNFVVDEDEEMPLEELMEIPPEFTSASYQGPQLNFKVVVQGEVYALLHPDYHNLDYSNPYFRHAFQSLERQVTGITDSAISSNAWKPWFLKVLKERPIFESTRDYAGDRVCDACNISKRNAAFSVRLIGPKYNHRTLESLPDDHTVWVYWDNTNKHFLDRSEVTKDDIKHELVTRACITGPWALGGFCHNRTEIAHYFYHWRWNLREQVKTALGYIGYMNQEKKIYIRNLPSERRHKVLEEVMERLDKKRHIARMYKEYRSKVKTARQYLEGGGRGWENSQSGRYRS